MKALFVVPSPEGGVYEFREIPVPTPEPGQVLVAVRAAGTNRGELLARPLLRSDNPAATPMRAGIEFAGEIVALGAGVSGWKPGDRIMARETGGYAEYAVAHQRALMRVPEGMAWAEAAAIPNVFVTAHDAIVSNAAVKPGESVLVTAGSSGVGTAIQIARYLGARPVLATTRAATKVTYCARSGHTKSSILVRQAGPKPLSRRQASAVSTRSSTRSVDRCSPTTSACSRSRGGS